MDKYPLSQLERVHTTWNMDNYRQNDIMYQKIYEILFRRERIEWIYGIKDTSFLLEVNKKWKLLFIRL